MIGVSPSMEGASLEDSENFAQHFMQTHPDSDQADALKATLNQSNIVRVTVLRKQIERMMALMLSEKEIRHQRFIDSLHPPSEKMKEDILRAAEERAKNRVSRIRPALQQLADQNGTSVEEESQKMYELFLRDALEM